MMQEKHLTSLLLVLVIGAMLLVFTACSNQGGVGSNSVESSTISSESNSDENSASTISEMDELEISHSSDAAHHVPIDDETMDLIVGTWRAKGVYFSNDEPIKSLDDNKNLADQFGRHSITINPDKTFEYNKKSSIEQGIWEYYGIEENMHSFAMKTTSGEREGTIYLMYLMSFDGPDLLVVHEQGHDLEDAKPVMAKTENASSSSSNNQHSNQSTNSGTSSGNHTPTTGEKNALTLAKSYLDTMSFSYSGLVKQLEYEGFTNSEATYGADNCGADWNEQAVRKAREYLNTMSFSKSKLIEQLEYEGFTKSQAEYGVSQAYQ